MSVIRRTPSRRPAGGSGPEPVPRSSGFASGHRFPWRQSSHGDAAGEFGNAASVWVLASNPWRQVTPFRV